MGFFNLFKRFGDAALKAEILKLQSQLSDEAKGIINYERELLDLKVRKEQELLDLNARKGRLLADRSQLEQELSTLQTRYQGLKNSLIILEDELLLQEFGVYQPVFVFGTSAAYKSAITENRQKQKELIKKKNCVDFVDSWTVDGSREKGRKMNEANIKQIIRTFNTECESIIDKVSATNVEALKKRIESSFSALNKMNTTNRVSLRKNFLTLKLEELKLAHEYQLKKLEEKEEQRRIKEEMREQAKLEKELKELKAKADKEVKHFNKALETIREKLTVEELPTPELEALKEKEAELVSKLEVLDDGLKEIDYREQNQKAGYVYVISNIGSFGENVYKIGMTRRLEPQDRVDELGGASVPFRFDVHALIFSENASDLESKLHKTFASRKLNLVNQRREFFQVTLEEIEAVVKANYDKTVEFTYTAQALEYRESQQLRRNA